MKIRTVLLLGVVVLLTLSCNLFVRSQGNIVYQAVDRDGKPAPELVVLNPDGEELKRVDLTGESTRLFPTRTSLKGHVLFQDSINNRWILLDVEAGEVREYDDADIDGSAFSCGYGANWVLFCGSEGIYLLDAQSGDVADVEIPFNPDATVNVIPTQMLANPAETHVIVQMTDGPWLVDAAHPESPRKLGEGRMNPRAVFSDDGQSVLYVQSIEGTDVQVMKENLDGSKAEEIYSGDGILMVNFVPKNDDLLLVNREAISTFSAGEKEPDLLMEIDDYPREIHFGPAGEMAVFGIGGVQTESIVWTHVNLKKGASETLDDLDGFLRGFTFALRPSRWLFLADADPVQGEKVAIVGLDLQTGEVDELMKARDYDTFYFTAFDDDGRVALVVVIKEGESQLWLLQADQKDAQLLGEASGVTGSLSPDGRWVVVGETDLSDGEIQTAVKLVDVGSGDEKEFGEGMSPVWVQP